MPGPLVYSELCGFDDDHVLVKEDRNPTGPGTLAGTFEIRFLHEHLLPIPQRDVDRVFQHELLSVLVQFVSRGRVFLDVRLFDQPIKRPGISTWIEITSPEPSR